MLKLPPDGPVLNAIERAATGTRADFAACWLAGARPCEEAGRV